MTGSNPSKGLSVFVTVGTQLPFDRLVAAIDRWVSENPQSTCFAQLGASALKPTNIAYKEFIDVEEYKERIDQCDVLVAHAGMGAILTALEAGKPIIIMPRKASLGEHRNDHQLATAKRFSEMGKVLVAHEENDLSTQLSRCNSKKQEDLLGPFASEDLIETVRSFLSS